MSNVAEGYLGDWLPHKESCRCVDCRCERAEARVAELEAENKRLDDDFDTYIEGLKEAVGDDLLGRSIDLEIGFVPEDIGRAITALREENKRLRECADDMAGVPRRLHPGSVS